MHYVQQNSSDCAVIMKPTEIQKFYEEKTVFITGGTGLVGKALVEKLLRSCPGINKVIVPIRPKRNASIQQRISEYFSDRLFDSLRKNNPDALNKALFISSNLEQKNCGINGEDLDLVKQTTNVLFHSAASVEFSGPLKEAVNCNIRVTQNIIELAKDMVNLQALIHVSTCWSHGIMDFTEEKVYNLSYKPEVLYNLVDNIEENTLEKITPAILGQWANTYIFTKNVSECLIEAEKDRLPVAIFRPAGVLSSYREPIPGWVNGAQAGAVIGAGLATGTIKVMHSNPEHNGHLVPVDMVVNCMIAVAWRTATKRNKEVDVYNFSPMNNILPRKKYYDAFVHTKYPLEGTVWTPGYITVTSKWWFNKYYLLFQTIPAYISDTFLKLFGQKPVYEKIHKRIKRIIDNSSYFLLEDFKFEYKNVPELWNSLQRDDQQIFNFDLDYIDWDEFMDIFTKSTKELLREDFNNMEKCEARRYLLRSKY